jgi:DnaJ-class molecular chaperone
MKACNDCSGSGLFRDSGNASEPCPECNGTGYVSDSEEEDKYLMTYFCLDCDETWTMEHSCACNDRCPNCNKEIEPTDVEDL